MLEIDSYGKGVSAARLDRTQEDLNKYRQRIDASVEHQKEYSDMMAALQQKVPSPLPVLYPASITDYFIYKFTVINIHSSCYYKSVSR